MHGTNWLLLFWSTSDLPSAYRTHAYFLLNVEKTWLWSEVYVYDILKARNNRAVINEVKGYIEYHFKIKNTSPVKTMLGINIYHNGFDVLLTMDQLKMIK